MGAKSSHRWGTVFVYVAEGVGGRGLGIGDKTKVWMFERSYGNLSFHTLLLLPTLYSLPLSTHTACSLSTIQVGFEANYDEYSIYIGAAG